MAIEVPEGVQGLFLVLTGEKWPTANEDALREVGNAWGTTSDRLQNELRPFLIQVVQNIRANFTGKSAIRFADMMAPYASEPPYYIPQAAEQFQQLKKFLLDAATQVEYVKIISIEELILLIAQIAWAIAMAFWTDGASMTWLAARMAIVRFLLQSWWGRLILQFALAELFGIAFQLALDVLTQAIQFAKHTRTSWDVQATISAVEVGAVGGLLSLPFSAISHFVSTKLTKVLSKVLSRDISVTTIQPVVVRAVNGAVHDLEKEPVSTVAKNITEGMIKAADKPLRLRLVGIGVPAIIEMAEEGLHEAITEGVVMAANGQGFQFNPFSFTSGMAGSIAGQIGHGAGHMLAAPKPVREGYQRLSDGDSSDETTSSDSDEKTLVSDTASTVSTVSDPFGDEHAVDVTDDESAPLINRSSSTSSTETGTPAPGRRSATANGSSTTVSSNGTVSNGTGSSNGTGRTDTSRTDVSRSGSARGDSTSASRSATPPPVPSKRSSESETAPAVPPKDTRYTPSATSRGTNGTNGTTRSDETTTSATPSSRSTASGNGRSSGTSSTSSTSSTPSATTPTSRGNEGTSRQDSNGTLRDQSRSTSATPTTPSSVRGSGRTGGEETEATAGTGQDPATRTGRPGENPATTQNRSSIRPPGETRGKESPATPSPTGVDRDPFRNRGAARTPASASSVPVSSHTALPAEVTDGAAVVNAANLDGLTSADLPFADRLIVTSDGLVPANTVQEAANRLGVDVVAQVDRAQIGNGRRKGVQWMNFPGSGGRPRPVENMPGPVNVPWTNARVGDDVIKSRYPWLPKINPQVVKGGDFMTNCLLAAIGTDLTLEEARKDPTEDPALLPYFQVPPEARAPYEHLANMGRGEPVDVPGYQAIVDAVTAAGPGSRGMVLVGVGTGEVDHVFNVVHDGEGIVFLDGQKGTQAVLPGRFRSLQFLPTSEGFPRHTIAVNPTPWQHGRFLAGDGDGEGTTDASTGDDFVASLPWAESSKDDPAGRYPFSGPGHELGAGDGKGTGIPGLSNEVRAKSAAERAAKAAGTSTEKAPEKAPEKATEKATERPGLDASRPRQRGKGYGADPATINDRPTERPAEKPPVTPFSGTGHRLGEGDGTGAGIPGLSDDVRAKAAEEKAEAAKKAALEGTKTPSARRPAPRAERGPVTIGDVSTKAKPSPFSGPGTTLGKGDGKGEGISGLSNEVRAKAAEERAKRLTATETPAGEKTSEPFSGVGQPLGEGDGMGTGIPGLSNEVRAKAAEEKAEAAKKAALEGRPPPVQKERTVAPERVGRGFDGDPMTFADLPAEEATKTAAEQKEFEPFSGTGETLGESDGKGTGIPGLGVKDHRRAAARRARSETGGTETVPTRRSGKGFAGDAMTVNDEPTVTEPPAEREPFEGPGETLGEGDGKGAGIPGLSNEVREKSTAERAERGPETVRRPRVRPPDTAPKQPVTLDSLRDAARKGGPSTSATGNVQNRGKDTVTLLEQPTTPEHKPADTETSAEKAPEKAPEKAAEPPVEKETADKTVQDTTPLDETVADKTVADETVTSEPSAIDTKTDKTEKAAEAEQAAETPASVPPRTPRSRRPVKQAAESSTGTTTESSPTTSTEPSRPVSRTDVSAARLTLSRLDPKRRKEVMDQARMIVGDLSGHAPKEEATGGELAPIDRAALLVAAEIARTGERQGADDFARALVHDLRANPPAPVPRVMIDKDRVEVASTTLGLLREHSDAKYEQVLNEARLILKGLVGADPSPFATKGRARHLAVVWLLAAAEIPWAGHQAAENLAADLLGVPRPAESGGPSRFTAAFAKAARNDPAFARATFGLMSDQRARQFLSAADSLLREASVEGDGRVLREKRLLVAAEIARSGRTAGESLLREMAEEPAKTAKKPPKQVRFAEETENESEHDDELDEESEYDSEDDLDDAEPPKYTKDPETEESQDTKDSQDSEDAQDTKDDESPAKPSPRMAIEDVLGETRVGMLGDRMVAIWLPGAPEDGPAFDVDTVVALGELAPEGTVFVIGAGKDGKVMAGGKEISVDALAAVIGSRAPGMRPFLLIDGGASVAEPLSRALDEPVLATVYRAVFDRAGGIRSVRGDTDSGTKPGTRSGGKHEDGWFHVYSPGDPKGTPILMALLGRSRKSGGRPSGSDPNPDPNPGSSTNSGAQNRGRPGGPPMPPLPPPNPGGPAQVVATPIAAHPAIRSIGVPRAGLPRMPELIRSVRRELDRANVAYTENEINLLAHRLLANYPYLIGPNTNRGTEGLQVPLGNAELLITLDPTDPHTLNNPAGSTLTPSALPQVEGEHHAVDTINATYATGAHVQTQSGQTSATRGALAATFGIGATPGVLQVVKIGASISGTSNQSNRSSSHIADAEGGHVEDNRTEASLVSYTPNWSFKLRTNANDNWAGVGVNRLPGTSDERLLLWIPEHYLDDTAPDQVTATGAAVKTGKLPAFHFASGLTNIPRLFDEIRESLQGQGLTLPMGSSIREELLQKLWNLSAHLDDAVNTPRGYRITLHNKYGRPVATVAVHSRRMAARRIGATSNLAHIENVRTAIDGMSGGHSVTNTSSVTPLSLEFDLLPNPTGIKDLDLGVSTSFSYTSTNVDGISAGRVGLNVLVPRNTSHTTANRVTFEHRATVSVRGRNARRPAPPGTAPTPAPTAVPPGFAQTRPVLGDALVRMPEAAAYDHGFSVDLAALKAPPAHGGNHPHVPGGIRNTGTRPSDPATKPVPDYVAQGKGVGMGLVMVAEDTAERLQAELKQRLRARGFLPVSDEDPFADMSWYGHGNKRDSQLDNLELLEKMVSLRGLDSHYDQIRQDGMTFTLRKRRGGVGVDWDVDSAKVTITAKRSVGHPARFLRSTNEYHTVNLAMGMDTTGMSVSHSRKLAWGVKFKALFKDLKNTLTGIEWQRTVGAADSVSFLNNRPELLEYPGIVDEFELTSDYTIKIEYQHSGKQGKVRDGVRNEGVRFGDEIQVKNQPALAYLLPLANGTEQGPTSKQPTPSDVLDQGVVYFLDTTGARSAATQALQDIIGPAASADQDASTYASTIEMRAHLKEILNGEYTTDRPFDSGLFRDTFGAMDISGKLGRSTFTGATGDKFVLGIIKLWLAENRLTDSSSTGWTWDQLDVAVGGDVGQGQARRRDRPQPALAAQPVQGQRAHRRQGARSSSTSTGSTPTRRSSTSTSRAARRNTPSSSRVARRSTRP